MAHAAPASIVPSLAEARACEHVVVHALAQQLLVDPAQIRTDQRLREDLGLDSLDLTVIALRLERSLRREFPLAVLELVVSVQDLVRFVHAWATGARTSA